MFDHGNDVLNNLEQRLAFVDHPFHPLDHLDDHLTQLDPWLITFNREHLQYQLDEEASLRVSSTLLTATASSEPDVLSQPLSQLSTTDRKPTRKRRRSSTSTSLESQTEDDQCFASRVNDDGLLQASFSPLPMDLSALRQMLWSLYLLDAFTLQTSLWSACLRYGTGQLTKQDRQEIETEGFAQLLSAAASSGHPSTSPIFWLSEVKTLLLAESRRRSIHRADENVQTICQSMAERRLNEIEVQRQSMQRQYEEAKKRCISWTTEIETAMSRFVHAYGLRPLRRRIQFRRAMLIHNYRDHLIQERINQSNPTSYQRQMVERLYEINQQFEFNQQLLIEHRERLRYNRPPPLYNSLHTDLPQLLQTIEAEKDRTFLLTQYERTIERTKTNLMAVHLAILETKIDQYQRCIQEETDQMWKDHRERQSNKTMTAELIRLIDQRVLNATQKLKVSHDFVLSYSIEHSDGSIDRPIGFLSSLIIDPMATIDPSIFTSEQWQLLRRGPTYVAPYQLHLTETESTIDDRIKQQYAPLQRRLNLLCDKFNVPLLTREHLKYDLKKEFHRLFSFVVPADQLARATYEKQTIDQIASILRQHRLILRRTADDSNTFYLADPSTFADHAQRYMNEQQSFQVWMTIDDETSQARAARSWKDRCHSYTAEIDKLFKEKNLPAEIYERLRIKIDQIRLPSLQFLPQFNPRSGQITVQPHIAAYQSLTSRLAHFLQQLLRPCMKVAFERTSFHDEADFIQRLYQAAQVERRLKPNTHFVTLTIENFHAMVPHQRLLKALRYFLQYNTLHNRLDFISRRTGRSQTITVDTYMRLMELFLEHNLFSYQRKIYQFTRGLPNTFILHDLLSTIYLSVWQRTLSEDVRLKDEFFGRYGNQFFFTWSYSSQDAQQWLASVLQQSPQLQGSMVVGRSVQFASIIVENRQGQLYTTIEHRSPLALPYVTHHPARNHRHWFRSMLLRLIRCCSDVTDFLLLRNHLDMAYLTHGYSLASLQEQWTTFCRYFKVHLPSYQIDATTYDQLRQQLMQFIDPQRQALAKIDAFAAGDRLLYLSYLCDGGPVGPFEAKFYEIWTKYLRDDVDFSLTKTKIALEAKLIYSLHALLCD